jgi:hypothetical protein
MKRKALETSISLHWGPVGEPEGGIIDWGLSEMDKGGLKRYLREGSGNRQLYQ